MRTLFLLLCFRHTSDLTRHEHCCWQVCKQWIFEGNASPLRSWTSRRISSQSQQTPNHPLLPMQPTRPTPLQDVQQQDLPASSSEVRMQVVLYFASGHADCCGVVAAVDSDQLCRRHRNAHPIHLSKQGTSLRNVFRHIFGCSRQLCTLTSYTTSRHAKRRAAAAVAHFKHAIVTQHCAAKREVLLGSMRGSRWR
jgi:hypothetical protein